MAFDNLMVFTGNANPKLAQRVAKNLNIQLGKATVSKFSDGEVMVELLENVRGKDVFVLQSTCAPTNDTLMELMIMCDVNGRTCVIMDDMVDTANTLCEAARALKEQGATRVVAYCTHPVLSGA